MKNKDKSADKTKKEKKQTYVDDGHTVYSMDNVSSPFSIFKRRSDKGDGLNRKEKRAAIKAALQVYLPIVLGTVLCFALVGVLMYFWLR